MTPDIPVSVWEQIPVIVIFTLLLGGVSYFMIKTFSKAVSDINAHYAIITEKSNAQYAQSLKENNAQWQKYFDARTETSALVNKQIIEQLEGLTEAVEKLVGDFKEHDQMERQALAAGALSPQKHRTAKKQ